RKLWRCALALSVPRHLLMCSLLMCYFAVSPACKREERDFHPIAPTASLEGGESGLRIGPLQPGQHLPVAHVRNPAEENAYAMNEGKTLYSAFNCVGCHAHGGGGIGPPLMDDAWTYGSQPEQVYASMIQGRPNGMPSYRGKITDD